MKQAKALFWSIYIDIIFDGAQPPEAIGGADVQQAFWARCFGERDWKAYSFYYRWSGLVKESRGIFFLYLPLVRKAMFLLNYIKYVWLIIIRPDVVVVRTRDEKVNLLRLMSGLLHFKLVYMIASDVEFETSGNRRVQRKQRAISRIPYVVAQNEYQKKTLEAVRGNENPVPVIPNIWYTSKGAGKGNREPDSSLLVWVGNLRKIKRPQWFIDLARDLPEYQFQIIGSVLDKDLYLACMDQMKDLHNIRYLGYRNLHEVNRIISVSRLLVCTSVAEGFPNTFLQAWSYQVPVLSTVDPNRVISAYGLGVASGKYEELLQGARSLLSDKDQYRLKQAGIKQYFELHHNPAQGYKLLTDYLNPACTTC